jgi:energy-coupling factor transporter transmembrane protein EcfT
MTTIFERFFTQPPRHPKRQRSVFRMPSNVKASQVAIIAVGAACINAITAGVIVFLLLLPIGIIIDIPWNFRWKIIAVASVFGAGSGLLISRIILHEAAVQEEGK